MHELPTAKDEKPTTAPTALKRGLRAGLVVGVFVVGALWIAGAGERVQALVRGATSSPALALIPGSRSNVPRHVLLDGQPALMRRCIAPASWSVSDVRAFYGKIADEEVQVDANRRLPFVVSDHGGGSFVLWTVAATLRRKAVIVTPPFGTDGPSYTLLDADPLAALGGEVRMRLPGGIEAPEGSKAGIRVEDDGGGFASFEISGAASDATLALEQSIRDAGWAIDGDAAASLDAARKGADRSVIPFRRGDHRGVAVVAPARQGGASVSISIK